jgi:hypothetical protein
LNTVKIDAAENHPLSFEGFFFNEEPFLKKQGDHRHAIALINPEGRSIARFNLFIKEQTGLSPLRAPFGSVEFEKGLPLTDLHPLITEVNSFALRNKLKSLKIVSYPECYQYSNSVTLKTLLVADGFTTRTEDHNFHLDISEKEFETGLHSSERRRLKKSMQAGFQFNSESSGDLHSVHEMISKCREFKGYPVSMNYVEFEKMFKDFPERYLLFTLRDKGRLVAATVGVRVNSEIIYNFMPADDLEYRTFSPMVLLMKEIYDYSRINGFKIFDMGTAAENGVPNSGLFKFKENLGGKLTFKHTFEKTF